jgi:putative ABC transport system permease protein
VAVFGMRPGLIFQLFLRTASVQRKRAILTIAAIAWGTLSLLLLLSFGEGLRIQLHRASRGMGESLAVMWPGETGLPWQGLPPGRPIRPRIEDIELLRQRIPSLEGVSGEISNWQVTMSTGRTTVTAHIRGVSVRYGDLRNQIPRAGGRFLNPLDEELRRRVVFIGDELARKLFDTEDAEGRQVKLDGVPYTVVGVLVRKIMMGNYGGMDADHALIPITTYKAQYGWDRLNVLVVKPDRKENMESLLAEVHKVLGAKYGFDPEDERVFGIWNTVRSQEETDAMMLGIQMFLGIIGALTLVVGGIGVANIMYAVVKERTREIGVKMALGARSSWITGPIVIEGLVYTTFGGLLGVLMAVSVVTLLAMAPTEGNEAIEFLGKPTLSVPIGVGTAAILGTIGLMAGYFPARRAARIDPAETLRYE